MGEEQFFFCMVTDNFDPEEFFDGAEIPHVEAAFQLCFDVFQKSSIGFCNQEFINVKDNYGDRRAIPRDLKTILMWVAPVL